MKHTDNILFFQRPFPNANMVLLQGPNPVLFDSGFGGDFTETVKLIHSAGIDPRDLQSIVNSHYHCDHCGGNHGLQTQFGVQVAAHRWEASQVNDRDPEACSAVWLNQPIEPYTVQRLLSDGDIIDTGSHQYQVIHTPGHTLGHISLYDGDSVLIAGDVIHADDVAWLNTFREGAGAVYRMLDTLDKLEQLPLTVIYSGHGDANTHPYERIDESRRRYEKWIRNPQKVGWHAAKRIVTYAIMLYDGMTQKQLKSYLASSPWYMDYCLHIFHEDPQNFVMSLVDELVRSGAIHITDGTLYASAPYNKTDVKWMHSIPKPAEWDK